MTTDSPGPASAIPVHTVSVTGRRAHNEDVGRVLTGRVGSTPVALLLVADGMGGHAHGEVAARLAADALAAEWSDHLIRLVKGADPETASRAFLRHAYTEAARAIEKAGAGSGMGTTLVAAVIAGDRAIVANVGDSRAYVVRDDGAALVTEDHSVVADAVRHGVITAEEAKTSPFQHALTRALDGSRDAEPDLFPTTGWVDLGPASVLLLCSDGLSGVVTEAALREHVAGTPDLVSAARSLVALALHRGSPDNVTVALAEHGTLARVGTPRLPAEQVNALLASAGETPREAPPEPPGPPGREQPGSDRLGALPWVIGAVALVLVVVALLFWSLGGEESRASTLRGDAPAASVEAPPRRVPSAFALSADGERLRWTITGVATRDDSVRVTVALPADTLSRTLAVAGSVVPLQEVARLWPEQELPPGAYVWLVEARSLSGSRLRSAASDFVLDRSVRAVATEAAR